MKTSTDRILVTHVGSFARPEPLLRTMSDKEHGRPYSHELFAQQVAEAVRAVVGEQARAGLDVVSDGEQGKAGFTRYVSDRLGGYSLTDTASSPATTRQAEIDAFPEYYGEYLGRYLSTVSPGWDMVCDGPIAYVGHEAVQTDIANLRAALEGVEVEEAFLPSTGPRPFGRNEYYASGEEYLYAIAEALREEYGAILDAGFVLQVDDPELTAILYRPEVPPEETRRAAEQHVDVLNHALRGYPRERIRLHTCYGINHGPRVHEASMREVAAYMLRIEAGAYSFEAANPRHQHEWRIWEDLVLPEGSVLIPGFVCHGTSFVEHPELVADMIETYARLVGRENVIAGADCGFGTHATFTPEILPTIVWHKLRSLAEGARLASARLWGS